MIRVTMVALSLMLGCFMATMVISGLDLAGYIRHPLAMEVNGLLLVFSVPPMFIFFLSMLWNIFRGR